MIKTEVISNLCLISINTESRCVKTMGFIVEELERNKVFPLFISGGDSCGKGEKIFIAICNEDMLAMMNVLGSIRHSAKIKNYSINCSNCMVKWKNMSKNPAKILENVPFDVKLSVVYCDEGVCFCDEAYSKKLCSILACSDIT